MRHKVPRRRVSVQIRERRVVESCPNECWSMDFVSDQLFDGRRIRILTIVDNFTKVSPSDNAFIESFNSRFRQECLNLHWFLSLEDARDKISSWHQEYNEFRPHSAIGDMSPLEF